MSLTRVKLSEEVWLTCVAHALTTEKEEVMGLLFGDTQKSSNGNVTALIWGAMPQMRCDRRKDRVETDPQLLANASAEAEKMTVDTGITTRVIGWYHSHPHITVFPSHVDVRTQAMYQILDSGFIGLIFSCYSEDAQKTGRIQVIAFQSLAGQQQVTPVIKSSIIDVETSWSSSGSQLSPSAAHDNMEDDSGDSRAAKTAKVTGISANSKELFSYSEVNYSGKEKQKETLFAPTAVSLEDSGFDSDSMSLTTSMQEAIHRSNLEMRGAEYTRKEVPLEVLPNQSLHWSDAPLKSFIDMQHVLFDEEKTAYNKAIEQNTRHGKMHPLSFIHHTSTYQASLCKLVEHCLSPAIAVLHDRLKENEIRLAMLTDEAKSLAAELNRKEADPKISPPRVLQTYVRKQNLISSSSGPVAIRNSGASGGSSRQAP